MNRPALNIGLEGSQTIDGRSEHVDQPPQHFLPDRHPNRTTCLPRPGTTTQTGRVFHRNAANRPPVQMFLNLNQKLTRTLRFDQQRIIYCR